MIINLDLLLLFIISKYFQLKLRSRIHIFFFLIKKIIKLLVK